MGEITLASILRSFYEPAVLWNIVLGLLAGLSAALGLWQWVAALRFPLHRKLPRPNELPGATVLKPLKGCDEFTARCLRSWFRQDYAGPMQLLFGVASESDPVCPLVRRLLQEFPDADAALVICPESRGANAKVSTLIQLQPEAKHDLVVVSDADVWVPPDLLANAVRPFEPVGGASSASPMLDDGAEIEEDGQRRHRQAVAGPTGAAPSGGGEEVGVVSCFYRLANPSTVAMQWEAIAANVDFWSQVLQSNTLKPMDFALGAVMVVRRKALQAIGGFESLADCLADDYQLGHRVARQGYRTELCPMVAECWDPPQGWREVWKHQLRWARTIRVCQPAPYFASLLNNATLWPLLWLVCVPSTVSLVGAGGLVLVRIVLAVNLQNRLTPQRAHWRSFWLVPIRDLLGAVIWLGAFLGNTVEWRGRRMRLRRDGTLSGGRECADRGESRS